MLTTEDILILRKAKSIEEKLEMLSTSELHHIKIPYYVLLDFENRLNNSVLYEHNPNGDIDRLMPYWVAENLISSLYENNKKYVIANKFEMFFMLKELSDLASAELIGGDKKKLNALQQLKCEIEALLS